jgi:hypothetical protein
MEAEGECVCRSVSELLFARNDSEFSDVKHLEGHAEGLHSSSTCWEAYFFSTQSSYPSVRIVIGCHEHELTSASSMIWCDTHSGASPSNVKFDANYGGSSTPGEAREAGER